MPKLCDLQVHINGQQIFFLKEKIVSKYCGKLKKLIIFNNQQKKQTHHHHLHHQIKDSLKIEIDDFPGGPDGFELISRFCYNNGRIPITESNVSLLHCCAIFLGMNEEMASNNLLHQTEAFLEGIYYWKWKDLLLSLKNCDFFYAYADSYCLLEKLICALLAKIAQNSDTNLSSNNNNHYYKRFSSSSYSSSSSPEPNHHKRFLSSSSSVTTTKAATPESIKARISTTNNNKAWWFEDLCVLPPRIIEKLVQNLGAYKKDNTNLMLTRFLLHYLKTMTTQKKIITSSSSRGRKRSDDFSGIAETAGYGVICVGKKAFSCRGLFWVLRILSEFGLGRDCRMEFERLIGGVLEQATLDDLLVSGHDLGVYYDVNLVIRLVKVFVKISNNNDGDDDCDDHDEVCVMKMNKVSRLIDDYLREISPDQNLKISKFLGVAECLPDFARSSYDGVYRAIDIYLQSHPMTTFEERSTLCGCLNYKKLSFEACKDLAKNPRIPPRIAMQALISRSQQQKIIPTKHISSSSPINNNVIDDNIEIDKKKKMKKKKSPTRTIMMSPPPPPPSQIIVYKNNNNNEEEEEENERDMYSEEKEYMKLNLERMQWRVVELEKLCREMNGQMSNMVTTHNVFIRPSRLRAIPRFC